MKILAKGNSKRLEELKKKLSLLNYELDCIDENTIIILNDGMYDIIFDLNFDDIVKTTWFGYENLKKTPVFVCAVKKNLAQLVSAQNTIIHFPLFGINCIETFINRSLVEVSIFNEKDLPILSNTLNGLNWDYKMVYDRVGMVTPRVIFMIINEACFTLQEGTAKMKDIDISMKLGTNYPFGPFEWADKIGIKNVYEVLDSLYQDTHDERYKICPLLKNNYLRKQNFYN